LGLVAGRSTSRPSWQTKSSTRDEMPGPGPATRLAYSAATVAFFVCAIALVVSSWLREPEGRELPD
jgi:cytochrome b561